MKYICGCLARLREVLTISLQLDDKRLRHQLERLLENMNMAIEMSECLEDLDVDELEKQIEIQKKDLNYII